MEWLKLSWLGFPGYLGFRVEDYHDFLTFGLFCGAEQPTFPIITKVFNAKVCRVDRIS